MSHELKILINFLKSNKVLIVDKNQASRNRLKESLRKLGINAENLHTTDSYESALNYAKLNHPKLILSDYMINGGSGFDLFKEYKANFLDIKDTICVLITSNTSQSIVAQAAEEDVDSFLIKPYSAKGLEANLSRTVNMKVNPSEYIKTVDVAKELMFKQDYTGALIVLEKAIKMVNEPSLAYFYHGQAQYLIDLTDEAVEDYKAGLDINKIHFKCQVGLYETLKSQSRHDEAYEVVRNISKYFPANPERLAEVVKLAIITENYQDMLEYYNVYTMLESRTEELAKYISAGMFISGKYQFLNNHLDSAYIFFEKLTVSFSKNSLVMNKILRLLIDKKLFDKAEAILKKYPIGLGDGNFELFEYLIMSRKYQIFEKIHKGELLFNSIKKDYDATIILLKALSDKGEDDLFNNYIIEATRLWPQIKKIFKLAA